MSVKELLEYRNAGAAGFKTAFGGAYPFRPDSVPEYR